MAVVTLVAAVSITVAAVVAVVVTTQWQWAFAAVAGLLFAALSWRLFVRGLYVDDHGVRVRLVFRTVTFEWASVRAMRPQEVSLAGADAADRPARQVCFDLADGRTVEAPVFGTADFDGIVVDLQHRREQVR
jgi:hypothetical protein